MPEQPADEQYVPEQVLQKAIEVLNQTIHSPLIPLLVQKGYEKALTDIHIVDDDEYRRVIREYTTLGLQKESDIAAVTEQLFLGTNAITYCTIANPTRPIYIKRSYLEEEQPPVEHVFNLLAEEISHANYTKQTATQLLKAKPNSMKLLPYDTPETVAVYITKSRQRLFNSKKPTSLKDIFIHSLGFKHMYTEQDKSGIMHQYTTEGQLYLEEIRAGIMQVLLEIVREGSINTTYTPIEQIRYGIQSLQNISKNNPALYYKVVLLLPLICSYLFSDKFSSQQEAMHKMWIGLYSKNADNFLDDLDYAYPNLRKSFIEAMRIYRDVNPHYQNRTLEGEA